LRSSKNLKEDGGRKKGTAEDKKQDDNDRGEREQEGIQNFQKNEKHTRLQRCSGIKMSMKNLEKKKGGENESKKKSVG